MNKRRIGLDGPAVHPIGFGTMGLEGYYGKSEEAEGLTTLARAIELGMMIDTADAYGNGHSESLVRKAIEQTGQQPFVATKFGIVFEKGQPWTDLPTGWKFNIRINGTPEYAKYALDKSLERLGVDAIDLWYLHYADPTVAIEETVGAMAEAVEAGKVRQIGLSNVTTENLRRANVVHPIAAVQFEYSLWRREAEASLLPSARELGSSLVAWSPLGTGFLAGSIDRLEKGDFRTYNPKLAGENLDTNRDRFAPLHEIAHELNVTSAQLALAWLHHQEGVIPIPGTRRVERVNENAAATEIELDASTLARIEEAAPRGLAEGGTLVP